MLVMVYVYLRISCVVANRHDDMVQIKVHQVSIYRGLHSNGAKLNFRVYITTRINRKQTHNDVLYVGEENARYSNELTWVTIF